MKRIQKSFAAIFFGLLLGLMLSDLIAFLLMRAHWRDLLDRNAAQKSIEEGIQRMTLQLPGELLGESQFVLHPYTGYVYNRDQYGGINAYGFQAPEPMPQPSADTFTVAVFGGSVALYCRPFFDLLSSRLSGNPKVRGKRVVVFPLALEGGKQPQQLMILGYLLSQGLLFDAVINLDGLNEIASPPKDNYQYGIDLSFPRHWRIVSRKGLNEDILELVSEIKAGYRHRRQLLGIAGGAHLHFFNTSLLMWQILDNREKSAIAANEKELSEWFAKEKPGFQTSGPFDPGLSPDQALDRSVKIWSESSRQMNALCRSNGIIYLHFLQPNQYVDGSKPFSPKEQDLMKKESLGVGRLASKGMPLLVEEGRILKAEGVPFFRLNQAFHKRKKYGLSRQLLSFQ